MLKSRNLIWEWVNDDNFYRVLVIFSAEGLKFENFVKPIFAQLLKYEWVKVQEILEKQGNL